MNNHRVLVIAPHSDDEVLGAGGTIALLAQSGADVTVVAVSSDVPPLYAPGVKEQVQAEALRSHHVLGVADSIFLDHPSVELSRMPVAELNAGLQRVVDELEPTMVLIPFPDRHLDHKAVFDASVVVTRPIGAGRAIQLVAMYETISETFWNVPGAEPAFSPNWTVDISTTVGEKVKSFEQFASQLQPFPSPRSPEALEALALFRGSQSSLAYGEAFQIVRSTFSPLQWAAPAVTR